MRNGIGAFKAPFIESSLFLNCFFLSFFISNIFVFLPRRMAVLFVDTSSIYLICFIFFSLFELIGGKFISSSSPFFLDVFDSVLLLFSLDRFTRD